MTADSIPSTASPSAEALASNQDQSSNSTTHSVEQASNEALKAGARDAAGKMTGGRPLEKLVVAIHGIGDPYRFATIQSVVTRFARHFDHPGGVPLGSFYSYPSTANAANGSATTPTPEVSTYRLEAPPDVPSGLDTIGFVEAYWAEIPRGLQREGFTIEESKTWARTVVDRVRARYSAHATSPLAFSKKDYGEVTNVIEEMIETLRILGNLLHIAEKAGIVKFELDDLLTNYLGDVQIVADFPKYRHQILNQFRAVLDGVWETVEKTPEKLPEIHIIAHSEGTVIAFMGLLQAMNLPQNSANSKDPTARPPWLDHVRGFMTFGSPIDKHLLLWPRIWDHCSSPVTPAGSPANAKDPAMKDPIQWRNYYDYGDPVGFKLDTAQDWMVEKGFSSSFKKYDHGFGRYLLPGAAHIQYWGDKTVFGHFIQTVMGLHPLAAGDCFKDAPSTRPLARLGANVIPYLLAFSLLYGGTYLLFKAVEANLQHDSPPSMKIFLGGVSGTTVLLAGSTLLARIPMLTRLLHWRLTSALLFLLSSLLYVRLVAKNDRSWFGFVVPKESAWEFVNGNFKINSGTLITLGLALALPCIALILWKTKHPWDWLRPFLAGLRPFFIPAAFAVSAIIIFRLAKESGDHPLWPLVLAGVAFLYLWWLATLVFDLTFVWHRYIRSALFQECLAKYWRQVAPPPQPKVVP